jgi:Mn2+/Fe2+ NRAMP family transporter
VAAGAGIILIPNIPLIPIMLWSQVINGVLLPLVLVFMLNLINDRDLMGEYVNSRAFNLVAWATTVIMIVLTTLLVFTSIFPGLL